MTPQEYNDIKIITTRKEWRTYCSFLDSEVTRLAGIVSMKNIKSKEELWDLRNKILGIEHGVLAAEQAVNEFENQRKGE